MSEEMDSEKNLDQGTKDHFKRKSLQDILEDNEVDFEHPELSKLLQQQQKHYPQKSQQQTQIEELRYQRFMATQELMMERFCKIERTVGKLAKRSQEHLDLSLASKFNEEQFWESKDFNRDDRVKKGTHIGFMVLLAIAVGLLVPYFESEK